MATEAFPIRVVGADAVAEALRAAPAKIQAAVRRAVEESAARVLSAAKAKVSDEVLHVKTGRLRRSLHYVLGGTDTAPSAAIGTNVEYAAIHEFGGQTKAHVIEALNAKVLSFRNASGDPVFATRVNHPGSRMPQRSFLRSALAQEASGIKQRIAAAVGGALPGR
jgi:phage gpG-like protein